MYYLKSIISYFMDFDFLPILSVTIFFLWSLMLKTQLKNVIFIKANESR